GGPLTKVYDPASGLGAVFERTVITDFGSVIFKTHMADFFGPIADSVLIGNGGPLTTLLSRSSNDPLGYIWGFGASRSLRETAVVTSLGEILLADGSTTQTLLPAGAISPSGLPFQPNFRVDMNRSRTVAFYGAAGFATVGGGTTTQIASFSTGDYAPYDWPGLNDAGVVSFLNYFNTGATIFAGSGGPLAALVRAGVATPPAAPY